MADDRNHKCSTCGAANASWGVGPPARKQQEWFCHLCFQGQPEGQETIMRRIGEMADG